MIEYPKNRKHGQPTHCYKGYPLIGIIKKIKKIFHISNTVCVLELRKG